jgi:hypothetical protein
MLSPTFERSLSRFVTQTCTVSPTAATSDGWRTKVDPNAVHAVFDNVTQGLLQQPLVKVMLILADADASGRDFHQLRERVLQASSESTATLHPVRNPGSIAMTRAPLTGGVISRFSVFLAKSFMASSSVSSSVSLAESVVQQYTGKGSIQMKPSRQILWYRCLAETVTLYKI